MSLYRKAIKYLKIKDYTLAIVTFTEALEKGYANPEINYYLALCYANLDYYEDSLAEIDIALDSELEDKYKIQLLNLQGYIYSKLEKYDESLNSFEKVLETDKNNQMAVSGIGYNYFIKKDYKTALEYYNKVYNMMPDNPKNENNLGYLMMINKQDLKKAVELCESALEKQPDNPAVLDSVAWGNFLIDNLKKAVLTITKAYKSAPSIFDISEHYKKIVQKVKQLIKK
jgi:tetratricopeptide (TPR) repeat protein